MKLVFEIIIAAAGLLCVLPILCLPLGGSVRWGEPETRKWWQVLADFLMNVGCLLLLYFVFQLFVRNLSCL